MNFWVSHNDHLKENDVLPQVLFFAGFDFFSFGLPVTFFFLLGLSTEGAWKEPYPILNKIISQETACNSLSRGPVPGSKGKPKVNVHMN